MSGLPRAAFVAFMTEVISLKRRADPDASRLRGWTNAAWTVHCYNRLRGAISEDQFRTALVHAIRRPAGQEAVYDGAVETPVFFGDDGRGKGPTWSIAKHLKRLLPEMGGTDPLIRAAFAMLDAGPAAYDGLAHAETSVTLHSAADSDAISAMLTSAFFNRVRHGSLQVPTIGAYRAMIREADAQPHLEAIELLIHNAGSQWPS